MPLRKYIPHAGKQLNQTTIRECSTDDDAGLGDILGVHVDRTQDESGEGESTQAQRSRVTELAALDGLIQTRLELTTKGRQTSLVGVDLSQRAVSEASRRFGSFALLVGHLGHEVGAIGRGGRNADVLIDTVVHTFSRHCGSRKI